MTKAYLAGFIAGLNGKGWEDNPFVNHMNGTGSFTINAANWRRGCDDGNQVANGDTDVGIQTV